MTYTVNDLATLKKLRQEKTLKNSIRKIKLKVDDASAPSLEKKLNRHFFACGCQEGSIVVSITMALSLITWVVTGFPRIQPWWLPIVVFAIASITGKLTGLIISRHKLKTLFNVLEEYFSNSNVPSEHL